MCEWRICKIAVSGKQESPAKYERASMNRVHSGPCKDGEVVWFAIVADCSIGSNPAHTLLFLAETNEKHIYGQRPQRPRMKGTIGFYLMTQLAVYRKHIYDRPNCITKCEHYNFFFHSVLNEAASPGSIRFP